MHKMEKFLQTLFDDAWYIYIHSTGIEKKNRWIEVLQCHEDLMEYYGL